MTDPSTLALAFLDRDRPAVDAALRQIVPSDAPVLEPLRYAIDGGGKRLRPLICVAAYRAVAGDAPPAVFRLAAGLELIHTYSLIHDDLPSMDDDEFRRGRPSAHRVHGVAAATVAGAAAIPLAAVAVRDAARELGAGPDEAARMVVTLCAAAGAGGMVGGQLLDLAAEGRPLALEELERIHRLKTGALIAAAPVLGGIAAGGAAIILDALKVYGTATGLAFQIMDDILDVTGSTAVLGKTAGRDTALEKATFPGLAGMDAARARAEREVDVARAALIGAGLRSPELESLARYAVERDR